MAIFMAKLNPGLTPSPCPPLLHFDRTYPPGASVSAWTSVQEWLLQMLLTAIKQRGSSRHSKVQMFLFSFPCFGLVFFSPDLKEEAVFLRE